jgi:hypothetical protein
MVTDNTIEIYLMPDMALFWYGYSSYVWRIDGGNNNPYREPNVTINTNNNIISLSCDGTRVGDYCATYINKPFNSFKIFMIDGTLGNYGASDNIAICSIINNVYTSRNTIVYNSPVQNSIKSATFEGTAGYHGIYLQNGSRNKTVSCTYGAIWLE